MYRSSNDDKTIRESIRKQVYKDVLDHHQYQASQHHQSLQQTKKAEDAKMLEYWKVQGVIISKKGNGWIGLSRRGRGSSKRPMTLIRGRWSKLLPVRGRSSVNSRICLGVCMRGRGRRGGHSRRR